MRLPQFFKELRKRKIEVKCNEVLGKAVECVRKVYVDQCEYYYFLDEEIRNNYNIIVNEELCDLLKTLDKSIEKLIKQYVEYFTFCEEVK